MHEKASQIRGPGSIPGRVSFRGCGFSSIVRQMLRKLRPNQVLDIIDHHNESFHTSANDLRCTRAIKPLYRVEGK